MVVHRTIYTTNITLFNVPINILKVNRIFKLGESVAVLKTISNTHIIITLFNIIINIIKRTIIFTVGDSVAVFLNHIHYSHHYYWNQNTVER